MITIVGAEEVNRKEFPRALSLLHGTTSNNSYYQCSTAKFNPHINSKEFPPRRACSSVNKRVHRASVCTEYAPETSGVKRRKEEARSH